MSSLQLHSRQVENYKRIKQIYQNFDKYMPKDHYQAIFKFNQLNTLSHFIYNNNFS